VLGVTLGMALVAPARALTIIAIGDSITWGVTRSGTPPERDPMGGYPGHLAEQLGHDVRVLNRGIGGSATTDWLGRRAVDSAALRRTLAGMWPDFAPPRDPAPDESLLAYVLASDRPDVVLVLLGVNDIPRARQAGKRVVPRAIAQRIVKLAHRTRAAAPRVLVGTLLPNRRDPPADVEAINTQLCALEPACVRLDRAFAAAGGLALLGDEIHPSTRGHEVIARAFAEALAEERRTPRRRALPAVN
jgi:lysophospholipase L1-like esterase